MQTQRQLNELTSRHGILRAAAARKGREIDAPSDRRDDATTNPVPTALLGAIRRRTRTGSPVRAPAAGMAVYQSRGSG
jgi:hypothetical protein